ncbi:MAG: peptidoglycan DD-metalloendopeptidase family protein [Candidatus Pacebacteria bacterium]|nr:peptidoglycan DD-metalloendopeptidase family protein [Candidatus Paceibacterota bacterium]
MIQRRFALYILCISVVCTPFFAYTTYDAFAQTEVEKLQNQIDDRQGRLKEIEQEIAEYQQQIQKVGAEKSTLQSAINQLELERKKVNADISYTQNKIGATDLEINRLSIEIRDTSDTITVNEQAISEILRRIHESDEVPLVESLLNHENLSAFWNTVQELEQVRSVMSDRVKSLVSQKVLLEEKKVSSTYKREELVSLKAQYSDQNEVLVNNQSEKDDLLKQTKNEEVEYQRLLADRKAAQEQLLKELRDFESKLQFILDPNTIPVPGTVVFNWPVANPIITQLFGGTEFAKRNAHVYGGRPYHPGVDFGAPRGTPIYAPLAGTVRAVGNTDAVPGCYSWGKWVLVDHANGLSTLYAHLSVISSNPGDILATGEILGYIGNTGYSTGPHLHFTVYVQEAVTIRKFNEIKTVTGCGAATTPVAPTDAYIDPMLYLPQR